jgi:hypothetical protein
LAEKAVVKFISKFKDHRLCIKPARVQYENGMAFPVPGKSIEFSNFGYETSDKDEIAFLRKHRLFNIDIYEDKQEEKAGTN